MNCWAWLFFLGIPALVHGPGPESGRWLRVGRLMLAVVLGYVFANVALH